MKRKYLVFNKIEQWIGTVYARTRTEAVQEAKETYQDYYNVIIA